MNSQRPPRGVDCDSEIVLVRLNDLAALGDCEALKASILNGGIFSLFQSPSQIVEEVLIRLGEGEELGVASCWPSEESHDADDDDDSLGASRFPRTVLRCERSCMMGGDVGEGSWTLWETSTTMGTAEKTARVSLGSGFNTERSRHGFKLSPVNASRYAHLHVTDASRSR